MMSFRRYYMPTFVPYYTISVERKRWKYVSNWGAMRYKSVQSATKSSMRQRDIFQDQKPCINSSLHESMSEVIKWKHYSPRRYIIVQDTWLFNYVMVKLSLLGTATTTGLRYQPQMTENSDCGYFLSIS